MTDLLLQIAISNVCLSLALAIVAVAVEKTAKRPHIAHLLWLLVFVKLVTPPVVTIPIIAIPGLSDSTVVATDDYSRQGPAVTGNRVVNAEEHQDGAATQISGSAANGILSAETWSVVLGNGKTGLSLVWITGSMAVFAWSLVRVYRFNRLLGIESEVAPQELQTGAARIARRLGLKATPTIYTTSANLSPMVWWIGGKVRIVVPAALLDQVDTRQFQWILAHELAHVRRRDYLVRWIEWLACVCFWWNPVVWLARRNLRANEELCCDALVVSSLKPKRHAYANSLLRAVECLACPALRPPAMASEINSGGFLERRFRMIVSEAPSRSKWRWLQVCVLLCAIVVLPLGVAYANDGKACPDAHLKEVQAKLHAAVEAGKISAEEAKAKMMAIKKEMAAKVEAW